MRREPWRTPRHLTYRSHRMKIPVVSVLRNRELIAGLLVILFGGALTSREMSGQALSRVGTTKRGIYYTVSGRGEPLVLVHGFQTDHREWDEVAPRLGATRQIIRYDLRGHGRSAAVSDPFYPHEDLAGLLDELGVRTADVVGLSAGSNAALELALERPEMVRRLVMVSPGLPEIRVNVSREWMRPIGEALRTGNARRAAELWWESPMMEGTRARGAAGERYRTVVLDNARIWTQNASAQQRLAPPPAERLRDLRQPLLLVVGGADATGSQPQADSILARQPNAVRVVVPGAGHMISIERPVDLASAIAQFLSAK
jgi:3-oxoadipate enol-lactonase